MTSNVTSKYRKLYWLFLIVSFLLNVGPIAGYVISALVNSDLVVEKIALSMSVFVVLIMTIIAAINKTTLRSRVWVIIIALYFCLDHFITPLLIVGCCQIVDEWFASPITKHFKNKLIINKEIDKRS